MEFTLVIPILIILVVAVADFGRIYATGVTLEAATRDAAEAAANDYLADPPGPLGSPAPSGNAAYYDDLHLLAGRVACAEARTLPNTTYAGGDCATMPVVYVCVHDSADPRCGDRVFSADPPPAECSDLATPPSNGQAGTSRRWVEVRLCYRFTSIISVPLVSFGDFWLERTRSFVIPCYYVLGSDECG